MRRQSYGSNMTEVVPDVARERSVVGANGVMGENKRGRTAQNQQYLPACKRINY